MHENKAQERLGSFTLLKAVSCPLRQWLEAADHERSRRPNTLLVLVVVVGIGWLLRVLDIAILVESDRKELPREGRRTMTGPEVA